MAKRITEWQGGAATNSVFSPGTVGSVSIVSVATLEAYAQATVIRLQGCLNWQLDRTLNNPPTGSQVVAYHAGIILHHNDLAATALNPSTEQDLNWLWTCSGRIVLPVINAPGAASSGNSSIILRDAPIPLVVRDVIDSRAMRKARHDDVLSLIVIPTIVTGDVDNLECTWNCRVLIKG